MTGNNVNEEMFGLEKCNRCGSPGIHKELPCFFCAETKVVKRRSFYRYFIDEMLTLRMLSFCAVSIISGIFTHHFNYSPTETIAHAICLGIILPSVIKDD